MANLKNQFFKKPFKGDLFHKLQKKEQHKSYLSK